MQQLMGDRVGARVCSREEQEQPEVKCAVHPHVSRTRLPVNPRSRGTCTSLTSSELLPICTCCSRFAFPRSRGTCTSLTSSRPAGRRAATGGGHPASECRGRGLQSAQGKMSRPASSTTASSRVWCCRLAHAWGQQHAHTWLPTSVVSPLPFIRSNLYDVFINIRDDELEHVKTMAACQDGSVALDLQVSTEAGAGGRLHGGSSSRSRPHV